CSVFRIIEVHLLHVFFFQAEDGIRDFHVTGVQTCALPICGRPAQRAADFYAATRTLGVARGVAAFQRYGLHQRNGLAYVAVPIELVEVREVPAVRIARHLEDWASRVRRGDATTAVGRAVRRFDAAHLEFV